MVFSRLFWWKSAPIEFLHPVKLIHQLRFVGASLFPFLAIDFPDARLNRCGIDAGIKRGLEQLTRANVRLRNPRRLKEALEILRSIQGTQFEKTPAFNICDEIIQAVLAKQRVGLCERQWHGHSLGVGRLKIHPGMSARERPTTVEREKTRP